MLNRFEGSHYSYIASNSQCQWVVGQCVFSNSPSHKLITLVCDCCQSRTCTIGIYTSAFYSTHCWVINGCGNSMLNRFEGSHYGYIASNGQCQWVVCQCVFANCPTYKLVTFVCGCSQSRTCTIVIHTSAFYRTHCWIIHGCGNGMLNCFEVCHYGHIACNGQGQWVVCQCFSIHHPSHKLITFVCDCSQSRTCAIGIHTSALNSTHSWIINCCGNGMLNRFEGSFYSYIASNGKSQWIIGYGIFANCPTYKLVAFVCGCSQSRTCTIDIDASALNSTHSWIIHGCGNSMLNRFEVCHYGHIACNGQGQWIIGYGIFSNCPSHKLITLVCGCSQSGSCSIVIYTSAFNSTHCWIIHGCGNGMLNRFEGSHYGYIACNSQCQWIIGYGIFSNCPSHKLITLVCGCSQSGSCSIVIYTSAFNSTHCWIIHGCGNGMLNRFEGSHYGYIACNSQCQWIIGYGIFSNCPSHKLITLVCGCSQSGSCSIVIYTSAFNSTHCWIIHGCGNGVLNKCKISHSIHITIDGYGGWVSCYGLTINGPVNKLITFVCGGG